MRAWLGMTTTTCVQLVKQDSRGRVRYGRERREELLGEFERSGMSAAGFARLSGVRYTTFAGWVHSRRQVAKRDGVTAIEEERSGPIRLLEAMVDAAEDHGLSEGVADRAPKARGAVGLRIELPGGSGLVIESPVQMQMAAELVVLITERRGRGC